MELAIRFMLFSRKKYVSTAVGGTKIVTFLMSHKTLKNANASAHDQNMRTKTHKMHEMHILKDCRIVALKAHFSQSIDDNY